MIHLKSMHNVPPHLQRMLLQLQKYDMEIKCKPFNEMLLADALSRCPARYSQEIKLDLHVDYIAFTSAWIETLRETTCKDPVLSMVYQFVQHRWPKERRRVPNVAKYYWDFRDELSTDEGLLLKGLSLVIPATLRESYLQHCYITVIDKENRCYWVVFEDTGRCLRRTRSHLRPRGPDFPHISERFLQQNAALSENSVSSGREGENEANNEENSVLSGPPSNSEQDTAVDFVSDTPAERAITFNDNPVAGTRYIPLRL